MNYKTYHNNITISAYVRSLIKNRFHYHKIYNRRLNFRKCTFNLNKININVHVTREILINLNNILTSRTNIFCRSRRTKRVFILY